MEYKSPAHKILKVLKDGRDLWKEKTLLAKYNNKKLKQKLKYAENKIHELSVELEKHKNEKKICKPTKV